MFHECLKKEPDSKSNNVLHDVFNSRIYFLDTVKHVYVEPAHDKMACKPSLIRVFDVRSLGSYRPKVSSCGQRRL